MREVNESLLYRFLNKETTKDENEAILHWVSESKQNRQAFKRIHEIYHLSHKNAIQEDFGLEESWDRLYRRLPQETPLRRMVHWDQILRMAVSVVLIMAVGAGILWGHQQFFEKSASSIVKVETPKGEKSKILLADGTSVWLNSGTILSYDAMQPRKVTVEGEAFFEVKKDPAHPFMVSTASDVTVKVTGTRFNLRCYADEKYVETTLEEGQVKMLGKDGQQLTVLAPGQQALFNSESHKLKVLSVVPTFYSLWKNNELHFSDVSFEELALKIERWYGVSVKLSPQLSKDDRFTMTLKTESLREMLSMMQLTSEFTYDIKGAVVRINPK